MDQKEYLKKLQENYTPHERTKLDELKALDEKVKTPPTIFAFTFGIIAALILGVGMCLAMKIIGGDIMSDTTKTVLGVIVGCVGIALCIANYYIYSAMLKSRKAKYGNQIIVLSNELLNK